MPPRIMTFIDARRNIVNAMSSKAEVALQAYEDEYARHLKAGRVAAVKYESGTEKTAAVVKKAQGASGAEAAAAAGGSWFKKGRF